MVLSAAVLCLALTIYHESKSESLLGQQAVAQVVINRSKNYNKSICQIVNEPKQFVWTTNKKNYNFHTFDQSQWQTAVSVAITSLKSEPIKVMKSTFFKSIHCGTKISNKIKRERIIGGHAFFVQMNK